MLNQRVLLRNRMLWNASSNFESGGGRVGRGRPTVSTVARRDTGSVGAERLSCLLLSLKDVAYKAGPECRDGTT